MSTDLLALTAQLVDIPSESHDERRIVEWIEQRLVALDHLEVIRIGDNLVARTSLGRAERVVLAGHTDTVPAHGNARARTEGDTLWGLGAADMKSGLAVMLELAATVAEPVVDVTWVFYAREEVAADLSGLIELIDERPDLLEGDVAILGEPTGGDVEAGCQGTIRAEITLGGVRAHTARPWMGRNAVHRLAPLLAAVDAAEPRRVEVGGCEFREALQAVAVSGGVASNVVPDVASISVNHRFAPDRTPAEAEQHLRAIVEPHLEDGDRFEVVDLAAAARPALEHPLIAAMVEREGLEVRAKLGWTDVARFSELGVPAINLGPGDPTLAHTADERVERHQIDRVHDAIRGILTLGVGSGAGPS